MKLIPALLIIGIFFIGLASAELIIHTQPLQISQKINTNKSYQLILENTFDFPISLFEFSGISDLGLNMPEITIEKNSTKNIDFTATPTIGFNGQIISKISFKFEVDIPEETQTHYINITNTPENFYNIIRAGDTIVWKNVADGSRSITSGAFNSEIPENGTFQYKFNNIEQISWQIFTSGMAWHYGDVEVINKTTEEMAHNPNYDVDWTLNVDITSNPTNITTSISKSNFEIEYMKFEKGLMTINNTGNEIADRVEFSSDSEWLAFSKNEISINPGVQDWVEYTITPIISGTNQTNKTYNINIITKASNSEEVIKQISVFVPYKEVSNEIGDSDLELLNWLDKVFCPGHPTSFLCDQSVTGEGNGSIIYRDVTIPVNMTATDFYDTLRRLQRMEDSTERTNNKINLVSNNFDEQIPSMMIMLNETLEMQKKNEKSEKVRKNSTWILGFIVMIIVMIGSIVKLSDKKAYKEYIAKGAFKYRR